jgi:hypothetical protein
VRLLPLVTLVAVAAGIGFAASSAYTVANTVPATNIGRYGHAIGANDLKPAACASLTLTHLVLNGTASGSDDDLVLGTSGVDLVTETAGSGGGSCLIGGLGKDHITAVRSGNDICIANATAVLKNCATTVTQP